MQATKVCTEKLKGEKPTDVSDPDFGCSSLAYTMKLTHCLRDQCGAPKATDEQIDQCKTLLKEVAEKCPKTIFHIFKVNQ